jgi:hypothetical protein
MVLLTLRTAITKKTNFNKPGFSNYPVTAPLIEAGLLNT